MASGGERYPQAIDPDRADATNPLESIRFAPSQRIRTHLRSEGTIVNQNNGTYLFEKNNPAGKQIPFEQAESKLKTILGREPNSLESGLLISQPRDGSVGITVISALASSDASRWGVTRVVVGYLVRHRESNRYAKYGDIIGTDTLYSVNGDIVGKQSAQYYDEPANKAPLIDPIDLVSGGLAGFVRTPIRAALSKTIGLAERETLSLLRRDASEELVTLYRGVNASHFDYAAQSTGLVRPNRRWYQFWKSTSTPYDHNVGFRGTLNSPYTSWTTDPRVAENFALRSKGMLYPRGVVITAKVPVSNLRASPNLKSVVLMSTGEEVPESEVLVRGIIRGLAKFVP